MAFDRLIKRIDELHNPSVAGLDPRLEYVPQFIQDASFVKLGHTLEAAADAILQFNKALIDALYDVVPAIKPQAAYYEMYGWAGVPHPWRRPFSYAQEQGHVRHDRRQDATILARPWLLMPPHIWVLVDVGRRGACGSFRCRRSDCQRLSRLRRYSSRCWTSLRENMTRAFSFL